MATSTTAGGWGARSFRRSRVILVGALAMSAACHPATGTPASATPASATPASATPPRRLDRTVITRDEMLRGNFVTLYDAVAALRSNWLQPHSAESVTNIVWVYVDGSKVGDVGILKEMQPRLVNTLRFYDGPSATSRWGVDNAAGVIHVSTWSNGDPGIPAPDSTRRTPKPPPTL